MAASFPSGPMVRFVALRAVTRVKIITKQPVETSSWGRLPHLSVMKAPKIAPMKPTTFWNPWRRSCVLTEVIPVLELALS